MRSNIDSNNLRDSILLKSSFAGKSIPTANIFGKTATIALKEIKQNRQTTFYENYSLNNNLKYPNEIAMFEYLQKKARDFDESRFVLLEILGKGGFGQVYKAYDKKRMKFLAIKDIKINNQYNDEKNLKGILHEQLILKEIRNLESERFLKFYHIYRRKINNLTIYSIVMEHGISDFMTICKLRRENNDQYTEEEYSFILYKLCGQLKILESRGISQRDIKPQNLILTYAEQDNYVYKLIDFGAGYKTEQPKDKLIPMESIIGISDYYASPEVKLGEIHMYNPYLADVYSLGMSFLEMMAKGVHGLKAKLNFVENKYKTLGPIIKTMVQENFKSRPDFSKLKSILKKFKKSQPKEKVYIEEIEKKIKNQDNDLNSILVKMNLFLELDNKICKEYCQLAIEKLKNEKIHWKSRRNACFKIASFYVFQNHLSTALPYLQKGQELELKNAGKIRLSTIQYILNIYLVLGEIPQVEKYFDLYLKKNPNKKKLVSILDTIFPLFITKDINKSKELCLKSIEIKEKIYSQKKEATVFLENYLFLALINSLTSKIEKDMIEKIKEMVFDLRNKENNTFYYTVISLYYFAVHTYLMQESLEEEIPALYEDLQNDIIKCCKIMGDNNQFTQNLIFIKHMLFSENKNENMMFDFVNKTAENFPIIKDFLPNDSKEKSELEELLDDKMIRFIDKINDECCICEKNAFENKSLFKLNCNHLYCLPCIEDAVKQQMKDFSSEEMLLFKCPQKKCQKPISNYHLQGISKEAYNFLINYQKNICSHNEKIAVCPNDSYVYLFDNQTTFFSCFCKNSFCSNCLRNQKEHQKLTCEQANQ